MAGFAEDRPVFFSLNRGQYFIISQVLLWNFGNSSKTYTLLRSKCCFFRPITHTKPFFFFFDMSVLVMNPSSLSFQGMKREARFSTSWIPLTGVQQKQFQDLTSNKNAALNPISHLILLNFSRQEITWSGNSEGSRQNTDVVKFSEKLLHCLQFTLKHSGLTVWHSVRP